MNETITAETSIPKRDTDPLESTGFMRSLMGAVFLLKLAAATTRSIQQCLWEQSAATQPIAATLAESSTELRELTPEMQARLEAMLDAARHSIIEDGMSNPINERVPGLVAKDFSAVVPALLAAIDTERATPIVAAEVLKELGRLRNVTSHATRRWVLERALLSPWPFTRDGAGLGLASLGDPGAIPSLRRAVEREPNPRLRADLQMVIDELAEIVTDGTPVTERH